MICRPRAVWPLAAVLLILPAHAREGASRTAEADRGRQVFARNCAACHAAGPGDDGAVHLPGTSALGARYQGSLPAALERREDLTADVLRHFVRNGSGPMPMFRKTEVSEADIAALAAYLRYTARGGKGAGAKEGG